MSFELKLRSMLEDSKAQGGMVGVIIGAVVATILIVAVAIPVVRDVINASTVDGTAETILEQLPVLLAVVPLIVVASILMMRR